jgi:hypothetical protein
MVRLHDPPMTLFQRQRSSTHIKRCTMHDLKVFSSKLRGMKKTGCRQVEQQQKKDTYLMG